MLTRIRAAQHPECGYDRLVLDITGSLPSYAIRYVSQVRADPSDRLISLPGSRFVLITLRPAQAHTTAGFANYYKHCPYARLPDAGRRGACRRF